ncbi:LysR family transcriptional regulator [Microbacterium trichothecenolyticum]|uniref:Molybdate transport repressor ModE-like protein n=1 Tax=Microbacterium trichothecenolyticum TaxID=69370 RepID=A0ABU0TSF5_MICTR|nr:LysR family transcriptional regulator [Microbacterium trichothecenolyticum]MDQ1121894.1 molybdate transport repressor ModE-like protein [Microbacterium trichothecenolyticum]
MNDVDDALDAHALRVVKAIADAGSITGAARSLGYSQPAVSQQVRRLERRAGMPIVERVGRGVRLTEAGRVLARHAATVTTALDAAAGDLAELRGLRAGRVRIVAFPSASSTVVPRVIAAVTARRPGVSISFVEAEPPEAIAAVREDRADIALTYSYPGDRREHLESAASGLSVHPMGADDTVVVVPADHPAASHDPIDLSQLAGERWIAGCPQCRGHLLEACERAGFTPDIAFETDNFIAVENLVAQGVGMAILPRMAVASLPMLSGIAAPRLPVAEARTLHLVTAGGAEFVPAVGASLEIMAAELAAHRRLSGERTAPR